MMLTITDIQKGKGKGWRIYVEGEYALSLQPEVLAGLSLKIGGQITPEELDEIKKQSDRVRARERALYLLEYRSHSCKELYDKLAKTVPEDIAAETVAKMLDLGLLDDVAYARRLAQSLWSEKKYGPKRISGYLYQKGIARDVVAQVLDELEESLDEEETGERLLAMIERKYAKHLADGEPKNLAKVQNALARLGYNFDDINRAIRNWKETKE